MPKVVINSCHGGFGLSDAAMDEYKSLAGVTDPDFYAWDIPRDSPHLVAMFEEQGNAINGWAAELKVVDVPDDADWYIDEYDGKEWVAERHRTWS
jgi:hypothetical protein